MMLNVLLFHLAPKNMEFHDVEEEEEEEEPEEEEIVQSLHRRCQNHSAIHKRSLPLRPSFGQFSFRLTIHNGKRRGSGRVPDG